MTWLEVLIEAQEMMAREGEFLGALLTRSILDHRSFGQGVVNVILSAFFSDEESECQGLARQEWETLLSSCFAPNVFYEPNDRLTLEDLGMKDLAVVKDRDPAAGGLINPFLFFKGFKAIQAHRIAHVLWNSGKKRAALSIQSKISELYAVDIHPAAKIGAGLMIDHGTGIVIGETAVIGMNCSFLHGVTLGGTRKLGGNRHPKLGDDVLVGCCATLLGNIQIDSNSKIGSGSVVLTSVPACVTAVGNPARIIGRTLEKHAGRTMDLSLSNVSYSLDLKSLLTREGILSNSVNMDPRIIFAEMAEGGSMVNGSGIDEDTGNNVFQRSTITLEQFRTALGLRFGVCPTESVLRVLSDGNETLNLEQYERLSKILITSHSDQDTNNTAAHKAALEEWDQQVSENGGNLSNFLLAVARLEEEGVAQPDAEVEIGNIASRLLSDLSLVGIDLDFL